MRATGPLTPVLHRVIEQQREAEDVTTLSLAPLDGSFHRGSPGQFNMVTALGVGEAAISISSAPREEGPLRHTVRRVGAVTAALCHLKRGDVVGVRGPFGNGWDLDCLTGDVVVVAGGIGLAPLVAAVEELRWSRAEGGGLWVMVGAREPSQLLFSHRLEAWAETGVVVEVTVDRATVGWGGHVGLVTELLSFASFDPRSASALVCGPEVMIRFTARALIERGLAPGRVQISLERNMQCGVGWCGHCQLGPLLLCRDGPVVPYSMGRKLLSERER